LLDWGEIISKRTMVRAKDEYLCGFTVAEYKESLLVIDGKVVSREYIIPKDKVDRYDGREICLKIRHDQIGSDYEF